MSDDIIPKKSKAGRKKADNTPFVIRFLNALDERDVVGQYGQTAYVMLAVLAGRLDKTTRFRKPYGKTNDQLMQATGIKDWRTLNDWRKRLVDGGWLRFEKGANGVCRYMVQIPDEQAAVVQQSGTTVQDSTTNGYTSNAYASNADGHVDSGYASNAYNPQKGCASNVDRHVEHNPLYPESIPKNPSNPSAGGFSWKDFGDDFEQAVSKQIYDDNLEHVDADEVVEWVRQKAAEDKNFEVKHLPAMLRKWDERKAQQHQDEQRHAGAEQSRQEADQEKRERGQQLHHKTPDLDDAKEADAAERRANGEQQGNELQVARALGALLDTSNTTGCNAGEPDGSQPDPTKQQPKPSISDKRYANWTWEQIREDIVFKGRRGHMTEDDIEAMLDDARKRYSSRVN